MSVFAGAIGAELDGTRWGVLLTGFASAETTYRLANGTGRAYLLGGEALACAGTSLASLGARTCLGAATAAFHAYGESYDQNLPSTRLWAAAVGRLALRWPERAPVSLRLWLQGHFNITRPTLKVEGASERLAVGNLGGGVGLDLVLHLAGAP